MGYGFQASIVIQTVPERGKIVNQKLKIKYHRARFFLSSLLPCSIRRAFGMATEISFLHVLRVHTRPR